MEAADRALPTDPTAVGGRHLATVVCGWRGHVCPAVDVAELDGPLLVGMDLVDGPGSLPRRRLNRCLRCDAWIDIPAPRHPSRDRLPPPEELHLPRRGRQLRQAVVLRVIALERALHAVIFALVATLAIALRAELTGVKSWDRSLLQRITSSSNGTGTAIGHAFLVKEGHHLLALRASTLDLVIAAALVYCVVEGVEAVGLWKERRWAEYLTVVATVGFVPYEVIELIHGVSALKVGALALNLVVLGYLLWSKELFGVGRLRHRRRSSPGDAPPWQHLLRPDPGPPATLSASVGVSSVPDAGAEVGGIV